ncbi:hypothetical protein DXG03_004839 [Asterophora parasitica]|uniref:Uncharacterized protein n=1 Tax=Asterophora parasitica TaxID=117018 RepID=A0A9P7G299_9AGAR|nr:hypothetical protein DXG03_004839 [Asterophora parasitica]
MPEYVYALHDFLPEHEDEVSFHAGERIEVIERDDLYGDGWWQGRNLAGKTGLFPQSYTAPAPPSTDSIALSSSTSSSTTELAPTDASSKPALQALTEESEVESLATAHNIVAPIPQAQTPAVFLNGHETDTEPATAHQRTTSIGEQVMKATMTDVQQAIEQLGRGHSQNGDGDEARSFSFASSRGDQTEGETDTDFDMSDVDGPDGGLGESWHKGARTKLAEKARRAVEEAEKLEALLGGTSERRIIAPPIEVELSDESEGEEDYTTHTNIFARAHPHIPEEDEELETDPERTASPLPEHLKDLASATDVKPASIDSTDIIVPTHDEYDTQTATATQMSFPVFEPPPVLTAAETMHALSSEQAESAPRSSFASSGARSSYSTPGQPEPPSMTFLEPKRHSSHAPYRESLVALPSPTGSFPGVLGGAPLSAEQSKHNSVTSVSSMRPSALASQPPLTASSIQNTLVEEQQTQPKDKKEKTPPSEWSVEEVVDWLKSKGFDQDVCDKFTEQEITGDVLLELDVNLLKTEIGIMAFGKRMRIANAITDLRRPPSIVYSDHPEHSPSLGPHSPLSATQSHSRHQSQSHSHYSFPGASANRGIPYAQSAPGSSLGSPMFYGGNGAAYAGSTGQESPGVEYLGPPVPEEGVPMGASVSAPAMNGKGSKGRPALLLLSPSDGALKDSAKAVSDIAEEEDRGVASDSEVAPTTMRRRIFGRSHDSQKADSAANSRNSREGSIIASPTVPEREKGKEKDKDKDRDSTTSLRHARSKKSMDVGKSGERLSIFGSTFTGTLGKSRKPPPKYAASTHDETGSDKASMFSLPRRKASASSQHSTPNGTPKHTFREPRGRDAETRDPALLRKRTASAPAPPTDVRISNGALTSAPGISSPIKQGQSILEQIGEPDHTGWMRKKGDRYNSWKQRYFVLKASHLYCLRSNSAAETKIKGYINIDGYKVTVDENVNPGRYGFRIEHDNDKTHYFSSDEKTIIRDWMKAIMKATIGRDYTKPVISSCNIPTIPLTVAQAMNPAPRPPSPTARDATQKALRREDPNKLSSRDARILMGLPSSTDSKEDRNRLESFFNNETVSPISENGEGSVSSTPEEFSLVEWANSHLPLSLQIKDPAGSLCGGLALLRIAESIKGMPASPPVADSAFPLSPTDDKLDGLFQLFDFLLDNDVKMGSVSINDVRQGKRDKILQLLRALKTWQDKRRAIAQTIASAGSIHSAHPHPQATAPSSVQASVAGPGASVNNRAKYSNEDYAILISLALSDYALWQDPELRRKNEWSSDTSSSADVEGYFPLSYLLKHSKLLAPLNLENSQMPIAKAVRSSDGADVLEIRLLVSDPSPSTWFGGPNDTRDLGSYEIRRKDWEESLTRASRDYSRADWDKRTIYMENIPVQYRSTPTIARFILVLLAERPSSNARLTRIQSIIFPPHHQDKPGDHPTCKGFALIVLQHELDVDFLLNHWPWDRRQDAHSHLNRPEEQDASKFGLRTLSKLLWDKRKEEYLAYRGRLVDEINAHEDAESAMHVPSTSKSTSQQETLVALPAPSEVFEPEQSNATTIYSSSPYPFNSLVFVRNIHPETNKTTLRKFFATAFRSSITGGDLQGDGLDYVDFNKGMDSVYYSLLSS